jgi:hypothetical protein
MKTVRARDVIALEGNVAKNEVRNEIIAQVLERRDQLDELYEVEATPLWGLTLPGTTFIFEQSLTTMYQHDYDGLAAFTCYERSPSVFARAARRVPLNCDLRLGSLADAPTAGYSLVWADYCCTPSLEAIDVALAAATLRNAFVYITFCIHHRIGGADAIRKALHVRNTDPRDAVIAAVERALRRSDVKTFRRIYDVRYAGGRRGSTGMYTIGYSIRPYRSVRLATPIIADRRVGAGWRRYRQVSCIRKRRCTHPYELAIQKLGGGIFG